MKPYEELLKCGYEFDGIKIQRNLEAWWKKWVQELGAVNHYPQHHIRRMTDANGMREHGIKAMVHACAEEVYKNGLFVVEKGRETNTRPMLFGEPLIEDKVRLFVLAQPPPKPKEE